MHAVNMYSIVITGCTVYCVVAVSSCTNIIVVVCGCTVYHSICDWLYCIHFIVVVTGCTV